MEAAACRNADGSYGLLLLNQAKETVNVNIRMGGKILREVSLPGESLTAVNMDGE